MGPEAAARTAPQSEVRGRRGEIEPLDTFSSNVCKGVGARRKLHRGGYGCDTASVYTLNLVDQTLLGDAPADVGDSAGGPRCSPKASKGTSSPQGSVQAEQHRLATILPEPLDGGGAAHPLSWQSSPMTSYPLAADEWAMAERGAPCATSGSAVGALLEEQVTGEGSIDYTSDGDDDVDSGTPRSST